MDAYKYWIKKIKKKQKLKTYLLIEFVWSTWYMYKVIIDELMLPLEVGGDFWNYWWKLEQLKVLQELQYCIDQQF